MADQEKPQSAFLRELIERTASICAKRRTEEHAPVSFADAVWRSLLAEHGNGADTDFRGVPVSPQLQVECFRGLVDALLPMAARWDEFTRHQKRRAGLLRTNRKLGALLAAVLGPEYANASTRECFDTLQRIGHEYGLRVAKSDESDVLEWDDTDAQQCGDLTFNAFAQRRSRANKAREMTQPRHTNPLWNTPNMQIHDMQNVTDALADLKAEQLRILLSAGAENDPRKLPELEEVSQWLRHAAQWEFDRREGSTGALTPPGVMIAPTAIHKSVEALQVCGLAALAHDVEMPRGVEAAKFYLAVAGTLMNRRTVQ